MFLYVFGSSASRLNDAGFAARGHICLQRISHPEEALERAYEQASLRWPDESGWSDRRANVRLIDRINIEIMGSPRMFASGGFSMLARRTEGHTFYDYAHPVEIVRGSTPAAVRTVVLQAMRKKYPSSKGWEQHDTVLIEITHADLKADTHAPLC
jgi:hypothetical protein